MDTLIDILKILGAIFVLGQPLLVLHIVRRVKKQHTDFPSMSESQLIDLAKAKPFLHLNKVIEELKTRATNYHILISDTLLLATDNNSAHRISGWGILKEHFQNEFPEIDFSKEKLTRSELKLLKEKISQPVN